VAFNRVFIGSLDNFMYCLGDKPDDTNYTSIKIRINISTTQVLAGHAIENITCTALTEDDEPIPQAWFNFKVTKGTLNNYYGTAFEDGTYRIAYIAPEPSKVKNNITVTLFVNATRFPYKIGFGSVNISVGPRQGTPINDSDKNGDDDNGGIINDILKPQNYTIIVLIAILVILNIIIIAFFLRSRRRLRQLQGLHLTGSGKEQRIEKKGPKEPKEPKKPPAGKPSPPPNKEAPLAKAQPQSKPQSKAQTTPTPSPKPTPQVQDPTKAISDPTPPPKQ
jgi:hypothetical protein